MLATTSTVINTATTTFISSNAFPSRFPCCYPVPVALGQNVSPARMYVCCKANRLCTSTKVTLPLTHMSHCPALPQLRALPMPRHLTNTHQASGHEQAAALRKRPRDLPGRAAHVPLSGGTCPRCEEAQQMR